jgi:hypothetical protein
VPEIACTESSLKTPKTYVTSEDFNGWVDRWKDAYRLPAKERGTTRALLYVGHEPRVSWLVDRLSAPPSVLRPLARFRPPLSGLNHSELMAGRFRRTRYRPLWSLGPADSGSETALRNKIKSKMDTAKVFAGILTAVTTFAANDVRSIEDDVDRASALIGLGFFGLAILLYLVTMFFYDALLMPKRFWGSAPGKARHGDAPWLVRPPSSSTLVLFQNMVNVWSRVFVPATFAAGIGLVLFVYGAAELPDDRARWFFTLTAVAMGLASIAIGRQGRPRLGAQD